MFVTAIIAAAGRGQRFGGAQLKQLLSVGGRSILERSVTAFITHPSVDEVVVALPRELSENPPPYLTTTVKALRIVTGGLRRQDSVAAAFAVVPDRSDIVVIHDAARPFVTAALIDRTIAAAAQSGAAVAAVQARDTVKRAVWRPASAGLDLAEAGDDRRVTETLARESIFLAQTPQAFRRQVLEVALALNADATDEAALAEQAGYPVRIVEGEASNIKITTPDDLPIAEAIARTRDGPVTSTDTMRVGTGYDLHRLVEGRPLILGGVTIPSDRGLLGHSDADAVSHAVTDAVLGAAGAGDIGRHFPDTDPRWRGASSLDLLRRAAVIVRDRGYQVGNVDVVVVAERPKIGPHADAMRANLADALGTTPDRISIKGKTNEGVGDIGRGEAIAVHAIALVQLRIKN